MHHPYKGQTLHTLTLEVAIMEELQNTRKERNKMEEYVHIKALYIYVTALLDS